MSRPVTATAGRSAEELERLARHAAVELEHAPAPEIVRWAADTFGDRLCVTSSMADAVMVDVVSAVVPGVDVLFLDTGYHFAETLGTRDAVAAGYPVTLVTLSPTRTVAEQDADDGPRLHERDPDRCCALRKVAPLDRALRDYDVWLTGIRRDDTVSRRDTPVVMWDSRRRKMKVNPIVRWTDADVEAYIAEHHVLTNPLLQDGYTSVGCAPCTRRTGPDDDPRAGRWAGLRKTECGIHA